MLLVLVMINYLYLGIHTRPDLKSQSLLACTQRVDDLACFNDAHYHHSEGCRACTGVRWKLHRGRKAKCLLNPRGRGLPCCDVGSNHYFVLSHY